MKAVTIILAGCLLGFVAGCGNGSSKTIPLVNQIEQLRQEKAQLKKQIEQSKTENEQLKKQIQVLSGLPKDKLKNLYNLQGIKIGGYTNLYDKDKDGEKEKLIVYIQPIDEEGDIIKAAGTVDVQFWDLNKEDSQALLGEWHVTQKQLKQLWFATLITINYRLTFDIADKIDKFDEPLTVKVAFTDYLTGKVFKEQKVIEPR